MGTGLHKRLSCQRKSRLFNWRVFLILSMVFLSGTLLARPTSATVDFNVSLDPVLQVVIPADTILLDLTPTASGADFTSSDLNVAIGTNNPTGYHFSLHTNSTNLTKTEADNYGNYAILPTLEDNSIGYNETDFTVNRWGYLVNNLTKGEDSELYLPFETDIELSATTGPVDIEEFGFRFGAKVDMEQPAGTYVLALNFNAVANVVPGVISITFDANGGTGEMDIQQIEAGKEANLEQNAFEKADYVFTGWNTAKDGSGTHYDNGAIYKTTLTAQNANVTLYAEWVPYMQNVTASMCTTSPTKVVDRRDNTVYIIQRLNDGNCWMMGNLSLDGGRTLTPADTNVATNFDLPANIASGTVTYTTAETISLDGEDSYGNKYGNLYNYCAVTGGTICEAVNNSNATYDICPKGWRLPTGGIDSDFSRLVMAYGGLNTVMDSSTNPTGAEMAIILQKDLKIPFAGGFVDATPVKQGTSGYLWSSTPFNNTAMYDLELFSSKVTLQDGGHRRYGYSVRCMLETRTIADIEYMQDITPTIAANTAVGEIANLVDKRDNDTYQVQKLKDGKLWMMENLRLGSTSTMTLTPADTNIAANYTLPASGTANFTETGGYTNAAINTSLEDTADANGNEYGVYYNYCAVSAGTACHASSETGTDSTVDICPKGWRLPTSGTNGEFGKLMVAYGGLTTIMDSSTTPDASTMLGVLQKELKYVLAGYFYTKVDRRDEYGLYWSSTYVNSTSMHQLSFIPSLVNPQTPAPRYNGRSVRCVAK